MTDTVQDRALTAACVTCAKWITCELVVCDGFVPAPKRCPPEFAKYVSTPAGLAASCPLGPDVDDEED